MFGKKLGKHQAHGHVVQQDPLTGNTYERETRQCSHCGRHWIFEPGSGKKRGYCYACNGLTCGADECNPCYPYEQRIEDMEKPSKKVKGGSLFDDKIQEIRFKVGADKLPKTKNGVILPR